MILVTFVISLDVSNDPVHELQCTLWLYEGGDSGGDD